MSRPRDPIEIRGGLTNAERDILRLKISDARKERLRSEPKLPELSPFERGEMSPDVAALFDPGYTRDHFFAALNRCAVKSRNLSSEATRAQRGDGTTGAATGDLRPSFSSRTPRVDSATGDGSQAVATQKAGGSVSGAGKP